MRKRIKRVAFDIETIQFVEAFRNPKNERDKEKHLPKMRVACLYDEQTDSYKYFTVKEVKSFINHIKKADEVISYNGNNFDIPLLRKHYGLRGNVPIKGKHIDMWEIFRRRAGYMVNLNEAVKVNFKTLFKNYFLQ